MRLGVESTAVITLRVKKPSLSVLRVLMDAMESDGGIFDASTAGENVDGA